MIPVFRNGKWIQVALPHGTEGWSQTHKFQAAALYATAVSKGYSPHHAGVLAESYVYKQMYGVTYSPLIEEALEGLLV